MGTCIEVIHHLQSIKDDIKEISVNELMDKFKASFNTVTLAIAQVWT